MATDPHQSFRRAVSCAEEQLDLGRVALAIAREEYSDLDTESYLGRLDLLAKAVRRRLDPTSGPYRAIAAVNYVLFKEEGFHANRDDYFDPKNSFLNDVIDRKKGIPITLSVLYMEVARRVGLSLHGVGFPGHFLVKYADEDGEVVIDPFHGGEVRSAESLAKLLHELYGGKVAFHPGLLAGVRKSQIIERMLHNLKIIYLRENDWLKALSALERVLIIDPSSALDMRDRGLVYLKLECFKQALESLEIYLNLAPHAKDAPAIREQLAFLARRIAQLH